MTECMILNKTGNMVKDVIDTLNTFNEKDFNLIIDDFYNGINTIFLYKEDYDIVPILNEIEKNRIYKRGYIIDFKNLLYNIIYFNDGKYDELISKLRNQYIYALLVGKDIVDINFINMCFKILNNDELFQKFLDFENNSDLFSFNKSYNQEHYLLEMKRYFEEGKNYVIINNISFSFDFKNKKMLERYNKLKNIIQIKEETIKEEAEITANDGYVYSYHKQRFIDNDWNLDESIEHYIYDDMDPNYSLQEKIAYIYIKLCILLEYEGSYIKDKSVNTLYYKDIMESINVDNPNVLCSDFAHIFTKLINRLENVDARSVRCGSGNRVHEYTTVLLKSENIRIDFEPIDVKENFNDLTSAKLGLDLTGIHYIDDKNHSFEETIKKIYKELKTKKMIVTYDLIREYEEYYYINVPIDYDENIDNFMIEMRKKNIRGTELILAFMQMDRLGYFGDLEYTLAFYKEEDEYMDRIIIFKKDTKLFVVKASKQVIFSLTKEEMNNLFNQDILTYESDKYTLEGVGKRK